MQYDNSYEDRNKILMKDQSLSLIVLIDVFLIRGARHKWHVN
jgi:hypothetical protein